MNFQNTQSPVIADLAFVGLGLSNACTLLHLLNNAIEEPPERLLRIMLVERHDVHFTGVAYGPRSGPNSLIITTLKDFIGPAVRHEFINWIKSNEERLFRNFNESGGQLTQQWVESFQQASIETLESEMCVPRVFFGHFIRDRVSTAIAQASALGIVDIKTYTAEVNDIARTPIGYSLDLSGQAHSFLARKVILGIGPTVGSTLKRHESASQQPVDHIIDNPYEHNCGDTLKSLAQQLINRAPDTEVNVMIVGANASAIESSYLLFDQPGFKELVNKVFVMSPSGSFPDRRVISENMPEFDAINLNALRDREGVRAEDIYLAFQRDLELWNEQYGSSDLPTVALNKEVVAVVNALSADEKALFAASYGVKIGKQQRRAGDEYLNMADQMMHAGKIEHVKGKFSEVISSDASGSFIEYKPECANSAEAFPHKISILINSMGARSLHETQNSLIESLINRGICQINASGCGFVVDDNYAAADDLVITGPLIAGNVIRNQAVWHVEHAGRLSGIAEELGATLHREILDSEHAAAA